MTRGDFYFLDVREYRDDYGPGLEIVTQTSRWIDDSPIRYSEKIQKLEFHKNYDRQRHQEVF